MGQNETTDGTLLLIFSEILSAVVLRFLFRDLQQVCFSLTGFSLLSPQSKLDWVAISIKAELVSERSIFASVDSSGQLSCTPSPPLSLLTLPLCSSFGMRKTLESGQMQKCYTEQGFDVTATGQPCTLHHHHIHIWMCSKGGEDYWQLCRLSKTFSSHLLSSRLPFPVCSRPSVTDVVI